MELVATKGGVRFVNDSKATNVDAAAKSIESFDRVVAMPLQQNRAWGSRQVPLDDERPTPPQRSPEEVREMLSRYRTGLARGRGAPGSDRPEPRTDATPGGPA